jgi:hypothetical protein
VRAEFVRREAPTDAETPSNAQPQSGGGSDVGQEAPPPPVLGAATWTGSTVAIDVLEGGEDTKAALGRIFRPTPVVIDDPSLRPLGASGPTVLEPGDLRWFMAAARTRAPAEGLAVRFVPPSTGMGWDPAGAYRTFGAAVARFDRAGASS